jgi:arginine decarboxylase
MRALDTREIHGYRPDFGYRVYTEKAIEITGQTHLGHTGNGHARVNLSSS